MHGHADYREMGTAQYLCNWSLELLRTKPAPTLDFRRLLNRFSSQFEHEPGRRLKTSSEACKGDGPSSCERFTSAESCAQLAHGISCSGNGQRIRWNEDSYIVVKGPRQSRSTVTWTACFANLHPRALLPDRTSGHMGRGVGQKMALMHASISGSVIRRGD